MKSESEIITDPSVKFDRKVIKSKREISDQACSALKHRGQTDLCKEIVFHFFCYGEFQYVWKFSLEDMFILGSNQRQVTGKTRCWTELRVFFTV
jgi:hypothetical protein